jgi:hypothetical protein
MSRFVSPNELFQAAKDCYLKGKDPQNDDEWALVVNFWAFNIGDGLEEVVGLLLPKLYNCPLSEDTIKRIVAFQIRSKAKGKGKKHV